MNIIEDNWDLSLHHSPQTLEGTGMKLFLVVSTSLIFFYSQQKIGNDHWQCNDWLILLIVATHQSIFRSAPTSEIIQLRSFSCMFDIKICCDLKQLFLTPFSDVGQQDTQKIQQQHDNIIPPSTSCQHNMRTSPNHIRYVMYVWWI